MPQTPPSNVAIPPPPLLVAKTRRQRLAYGVLGAVFVVLGGVGVLLPVVPATPFLLIALWAYARSSPRMHGWLWHNRWVGPGLRRWYFERTIARWVKWFALGAMVVSTSFTALIIQPPLPWLVSICAFMALCFVIVARLPTKKR